MRRARIPWNSNDDKPLTKGEASMTYAKRADTLPASTKLQGLSDVPDYPVSPTKDQVLVLNESTGLLEWQDKGGGGVPTGGTTGQIIVKQSASDGDAAWADQRTYQPGAGINIANPDTSAPTISSTLGSIALSGRKDDYAHLPSSGNSPGDAYLVDSDGLVYVYDGGWPAEYAGLGNGHGTSFPPAPGTNVRWYRDDLGLECFYDGTRWLTVEEYTEAPGVGPQTDVTGAIASLSYYRWAAAAMYITAIECSIYIGSPNNASNYWTALFQYAPANNANVNMGSIDTKSADTQTLVPYKLAINSALPSNTVQIRAQVMPTGSPGPINLAPRLRYRRIIT